MHLLPHWVDDETEKTWGLVSLVSVLITLYAFWEVLYRVLFRKVG